MSTRAELLKSLIGLLGEECDCPKCRAKRSEARVKLSDDELAASLDGALASCKAWSEATIAAEEAEKNFSDHMDNIVSHHMACGMNKDDAKSLAGLMFKQHKVKNDDAAKADAPEEATASA